MSQMFTTGFQLHVTLAGLLPSYGVTTLKEFNRKYEEFLSFHFIYISVTNSLSDQI